MFEVAVRFIGIGGNDHPRLNIIFIIYIIYCIYRVSKKNTETFFFFFNIIFKCIIFLLFVMNYILERW